MKDKNAPAFPLTEQTLIGDGRGMTLRDYFAAKAMAAVIAHGDPLVNEAESYPSMLDAVEGECLAVAEQAYWYADAMLKAREAK